MNAINNNNNNIYNNNNNNNNNKPYNVYAEIQQLFKTAENNHNKDKAYCNIQHKYDVNKPLRKYLDERQRNRSNEPCKHKY